MSDFHDAPTTPVARKQHRCIVCYCAIERGEQYIQQTGFYEGSPYRNKYHNECWDALSEEGWIFEFTPGEGDPPKRMLIPAS
jgi:hypothetical protein